MRKLESALRSYELQKKKRLSRKKRDEYLNQFKGISFFCGDKDVTIPKGSKCCFTHFIGLPVKNHLIGFEDVFDKVLNKIVKKPILEPKTHTLYDYQVGEYEYEGEKHKGLFEILETELFIWIKKATGMGASEFILRYLSWKCIVSDEWKGYQVVIITGARLEIATGLIQRIRDFFPEIIFDEKETVCKLNGCKIEAYPSNHSDSMRGLPKVCFILVDEGDFFSPKEQKLVTDSVERYVGKNSPRIVWVSTPNLPEGLFDTMEKTEPSIYHKIFWHYKIGEGKIYGLFELENARKSRSFAREYELVYGVGIGNLFPEAIVRPCIHEYDLNLGTGNKILYLDPAWGSSKFAIYGVEFDENGEGWVKHQEQRDRPSPESIFERLHYLLSIGWESVKCDSAQPVVITFLDENNYKVESIVFKEKLDSMVDATLDAFRKKKIHIHPSFTHVISQLISVEMDKKGHPDKKKLSFDLGDTHMMSCLDIKDGVTIGSFKMED